MPTLVVDNGGCSCRLGWAHEESPSVVALNATAQQNGNLDVFVSDQIGRIKNKGTLTFTRPCDRGIITNWHCQVDVWKRLLPQVLKEESPESTTLLMTYAPFTPDSLTENLDEIVFEEFGFGAFQRIPAQVASASLYHHYSESNSLNHFIQMNDMNPASTNNHNNEEDDNSQDDVSGSLCSVIVDIGYSATYVIPCIRGRSIQTSIRRLNIGGKIMTSLLQETLSYRQYNMMDEVVLVNDAKEALCYIAPQGIEQEINRSVGAQITASNSAYAEWVLPSYQNGDDKGYIRDLPTDPDSGRIKRTRKTDESKGQCLRIESERFTVPEILFHPMDIGLEQSGIHSVIQESIQSTDPALHPLFYSNILITGGVSKLPNLVSRLYHELRPLVPSHCNLTIRLPKEEALKETSSLNHSPNVNGVSSDSINDSNNDPIDFHFAWKGAAYLARHPMNQINNIQEMERKGHGGKKKKKAKTTTMSSNLVKESIGKKTTIFSPGQLEPVKSVYDMNDESQLSSSISCLKLNAITKSEYEEMGSHYCNEKFRYW